jgi:hypothetical protein
MCRCAAFSTVHGPYPPGHASSSRHVSPLPPGLLVVHLAHEAKVRGALKEPRHLISGHISQQPEQRKLIHFFFFIAFFSTFPGFFFRSSLLEAGSFLSTDFVVFLFPFPFPFPFCCSGSPHRALRSRTPAARRAV